MNTLRQGVPALDKSEKEALLLGLGVMLGLSVSPTGGNIAPTLDRK